MTCNPAVKAEELPKFIPGHKILVVRSKQVTAETLKAGDELALVLRAGVGVIVPTWTIFSAAPTSSRCAKGNPDIIGLEAIKIGR